MNPDVFQRGSDASREQDVHPRQMRSTSSWSEHVGYLLGVWEIEASQQILSLLTSMHACTDLTETSRIRRLSCESTNDTLTEEMGGANWVGMAVAMMSAV